jgi:hypothetical protein
MVNYADLGKRLGNRYKEMKPQKDKEREEAAELAVILEAEAKDIAEAFHFSSLSTRESGIYPMMEYVGEVEKVLDIGFTNPILRTSLLRRMDWRDSRRFIHDIMWGFLFEDRDMRRILGAIPGVINIRPNGVGTGGQLLFREDHYSKVDYIITTKGSPCFPDGDHLIEMKHNISDVCYGLKTSSAMELIRKSAYVAYARGIYKPSQNAPLTNIMFVPMDMVYDIHSPDAIRVIASIPPCCIERRLGGNLAHHLEGTEYRTFMRSRKLYPEIEDGTDLPLIVRSIY